MCIYLGEEVRVKETAFPDSIEPRRIALRGRTGVVIGYCGETTQTTQTGHNDCYVVGFEDGTARLFTDEIEHIVAPHSDATARDVCPLLKEES